jgi:hypothetical protein
MASRRVASSWPPVVLTLAQPGVAGGRDRDALTLAGIVEYAAGLLGSRQQVLTSGRPSQGADRPLLVHQHTAQPVAGTGRQGSP